MSLQTGESVRSVRERLAYGDAMHLKIDFIILKMNFYSFIHNIQLIGFNRFIFGSKYHWMRI